MQERSHRTAFIPLETQVLHALAAAAEDIACTLGRRGYVAWDRERVLGAAQREFQQLARRQVSPGNGESVHVVERANQPLEALAVVWRALRAGNHVHLHTEPGALPTVAELVSPLVGNIPGSGQLSIAAPGPIPPTIGVHPAQTRVAIVDAEADRELAAYLLARVSLRRCGLDPRAVKRVFVCGEHASLLRRLQRLWLGVVIGSPDSHRSFAGPLPKDIADTFILTLSNLAQLPHARVRCPGERLHTDDQTRTYVTPALLEIPWDADTSLPPELPGPILIVHTFKFQVTLEGALSAEAIARERQLIVGDPTEPHGALMVERLPPGMPPPRPL